MRWSRFGLTAGLAMVMSIVVFCADSEASWFFRNRCRCTNSQEVSYPPSGFRTGVCKAEEYGWNCRSGQWMSCPAGTKCDACTANNVPPVASCGGHPPFEYRGNCDSGLYRMVCDPCTRRMRFAAPWERDDGRYGIEFLGKPCAPRCR